MSSHQTKSRATADFDPKPAQPNPNLLLPRNNPIPKTPSASSPIKIKNLTVMGLRGDYSSSRNTRKKNVFALQMNRKRKLWMIKNANETKLYRKVNTSLKRVGCVELHLIISVYFTALAVRQKPNYKQHI